MPKEIEVLAKEILIEPKRITIAPVTETIDQISQGVYMVSKKEKLNLLVKLINEMQMDRVLVFTRTKHGANHVVKALLTHGLKAEAIHGNKSQNARENALANFKKGKSQVLVATDVASRGIDIKELSFVINYDLPEDPETYIHRIGELVEQVYLEYPYHFVIKKKEIVSFKLKDILNKRFKCLDTIQ